ncbi:MAG: 16S rRNA (cytosine(1402)-N(4))-methyltransferase RsmH [Thermodesulfobacteriota bacterium]
MQAVHVPVMSAEVAKYLRAEKGGRFLDGTLGLGGHSRILLEEGPRNTHVLGIDHDDSALRIAAENLRSFSDRIHLFRLSFKDFETAMAELNWDRLDGAVVDLGVSSMHLDDPDRGFSFLRDGPLDMRMSRNQGFETAEQLVNRAEFSELKDIISKYGEEPMASRIANTIVKERQKEPFESTLQLAQAVSRAYPAKRRAKSRNHPATKTFQALRIAVNRELTVLETFLERIIPRLSPTGRIAVISFHSLEDRIVKWFFRREASDCICPREEPVCRCGHERSIRILTKKPVQASTEEQRSNIRSRSAKLRAAERL